MSDDDIDRHDTRKAPSPMPSGVPRTLVESMVVSSAASSRLTALVGLAVLAGIALAANLAAGDAVPQELDGATPYFAAATGALGTLAVVVWYRARVSLKLDVREDGTLELLVGSLRARGPFFVEYGFVTDRVNRLPIFHLTLHVYAREGGRHVGVFQETWGAARGAPTNWPERPVLPRLPAGPAWVAAAVGVCEPLREAIEGHRPPPGEP